MVGDIIPESRATSVGISTLATGHARSFRGLAKRGGNHPALHQGVSLNLAFLSPPLVEAISQGRQPVEPTATRLTQLDLPLD